MKRIRSEPMGRIIKRQAAVIGFFMTAFYTLEIIDWFLRGYLDRYGVIPRTTSGLFGIAFAPFLHSGFLHLISNTAPFAVLGWFVLLDGLNRFLCVYVIASAVAGAGVWLIGDAGTVHIGASGVVFGFLGYLLLRAVFERSVKAIVLSLLAGVLYGGALSGLLPGNPCISWEGHLFGFLGGALSARLFSDARP